ncbi:hypothetical protein PO883_32620 [Massilia sp. DJPM01]|uniref:hypothetical protein n=1 Tax=Massilia sp. DJPM01 TaxID=3024404 RepID=UPI00259E4A90|nr:hypothetical protein [Massilia sp. DJPM01]MDM5181920.1 hypothetical protein [Massilia sp. DJPM01]
MFEGLAYTAAIGGQSSKLEEIRDGLERISRQVGGTHLCYFSLFVQHGSGNVDVMDFNDEKRQSLWFCD